MNIKMKNFLFAFAKCFLVAAFLLFTSCTTGKIQPRKQDALVETVETVDVEKKKIPPFIAKYNEGVDLIQAKEPTGETVTRADRLFKESLTLKPDFWPAHYNRAHVAFFQKRYEDAERYIAAAQKLHTNKEIELLSAAIVSEKGDTDKAIEMYGNVAALYGNVGFAYAQIGTIYMQRNDCKEALKHYKKSGKLSRDLYQVFINKGTCYLQEGAFDEAVKAFEAVYEIGVQEKYLLNQYAYSLRKFGNIQKAVTIYEELIKKYPEELSAYKNLGVIYELYLDKPAKAAKYYKKYVDLGGDDKKNVANWHTIALDKSKR